MRERSEQVLRIVCLVLGALLLLQLTLKVARRDPLANLKLPPLPALTNAPENQPGVKGTNQPPAQLGGKQGTNVLPGRVIDKGTNSAVIVAAAKGGTNLDHVASGVNATNSGSSQTAGAPPHNEPVSAESSELPPGATQAATVVKAPSNSLARTESSKALLVMAKGATNSVARADVARRATNVVARPELAMAGAGPPGRFGPGNKPKDLPPPVQARVDRIVESELLGPVMRPLPMALLGIAGDVAFLRSANGQTGLVKAGDQLGDLKLVQIGVNRVLVEQDGQKKELMMFSGYGSESLLPKTQDTPK